MLEHARKNVSAYLHIAENITQMLTCFLCFTLPVFCSSGHSASHSQHSMWDILVKSDLLNIIILVLIIVYLANRFLPKIVESRKLQISKELENARKIKEKAEEELKIVKEKSKNLFLEIDQIKKEALSTASTIKKSIEEETRKEIDLLGLKLKREITALEEEAILNIQKSTSDLAIKLAEEALTKISKDEKIQNKLVGDFLSGLRRPSKN